MTEIYPTEEALEFIKKFKVTTKNLPELFEFINKWWAYAEWGWSEEDITDDLLDAKFHVYKISTAGWSGNEDIISALKENQLAWVLSWYSSRVGGHYVFRVK